MSVVAWPRVTMRTVTVLSAFSTYTKSPLLLWRRAVTGTSTAPVILPNSRRTLTNWLGNRAILSFV